MEFVFQLGAPCGLSAAGRRLPSYPAMVVALRHGALRLTATGDNMIVGFRLPPVVATAVLGPCLQACWDEPIPLSDLIGPEADDLLDMIAARPQAASDLIDSWLLTRLKDWSTEHTRHLRVQNMLFWGFCGESLASFAEASGCTERTLRRRCARYAGVSPKQLVMSGRVLRACALLRETPDMPLAGVAHSLGFNDQAAFTNTFRHFLGMTPTELRREPLVYYETRH